MNRYARLRTTDLPRATTQHAGCQRGQHLSGWACLSGRGMMQIFFALAILLVGQARAEPTPVLMVYLEREPFYVTQPDGAVTGLVPDPVNEAFAKMGVPINWKLVPVNRALQMLKENLEPVCSPGWYKSPEREEYARFSAAIYADRALVGLSRSDFPVKQGISANELFGRKGIQFLGKTNFSYGPYLDALIKKKPEQEVQRTSAPTVSNLVAMIAKRRADFTIVTQEEVAMWVKQEGYTMGDFKVLTFSDVPAFEKRYILCSKLVPEQFMADLDAAILATIRKKGLDKKP